MAGYVYILRCSDGSFYTGSTTHLEKRIAQHMEGLGANHTKFRLPVKLVYYERYVLIKHAYLREKQIQKWSRAKKKALIEGRIDDLPSLAIAYRDL